MSILSPTQSENVRQLGLFLSQYDVNVDNNALDHDAHLADGTIEGLPSNVKYAAPLIDHFIAHARAQHHDGIKWGSDLLAQVYVQENNTLHYDETLKCIFGCSEYARYLNGFWVRGADVLKRSYDILNKKPPPEYIAELNEIDMTSWVTRYA